MALSARRPGLVALLGVTSLLLAAPAGTAAAAPAAPGARAVSAPTGVTAPLLSAVAEQQVLVPGGTTRIAVSRSTDGGRTWAPAEHAVLRAPRQQVAQVGRDGNVRALAPGRVTVHVRSGRAEASVVVEVADQEVADPALVSEDVRTPPSCDCSGGVLSGSGFGPSSTVALTTDGTPGLRVDASAVTDADGAFAGVVGDDGYALSGPRWSVDRGGSGLPEDACAPGTAWTITATDADGATASLHGTC